MTPGQGLGGLVPAATHGNNATAPAAAAASNPSPTPTTMQEPADTSHAEGMLKDMLERAKAHRPNPSPGVCDETRVLTLFLGADIGGMM